MDFSQVIDDFLKNATELDEKKKLAYLSMDVVQSLLGEIPFLIKNATKLSPKDLTAAYNQYTLSGSSPRDIIRNSYATGVVYALELVAKMLTHHKDSISQCLTREDIEKIQAKIGQDCAVAQTVEQSAVNR